MLLVGGNDCKLHAYEIELFCDSTHVAAKDKTKTFMTKQVSQFDAPVSRVHVDSEAELVIAVSEAGLVKVISFYRRTETAFTQSGGKKHPVPVEFRLELVCHIQQSITCFQARWKEDRPKPKAENVAIDISSFELGLDSLPN